jgi:hypothetical protein
MGRRLLVTRVHDAGSVQYAFPDLEAVTLSGQCTRANRYNHLCDRILPLQAVLARAGSLRRPGSRFSTQSSLR